MRILLIVTLAGALGAQEVNSTRIINADKDSHILSVPNVYMAFLGPYDLSMTLGIPGQVTHERVREAMRSVGSVAARHGVALGTYANTIEHAELWLKEGVRYLACGVDQNILLRAASDIVWHVTGIAPG